MEFRAAVYICEKEDKKDMMKVPHTYSEWVEILNMLKEKKDDDAALRAMKEGTLEWQIGVAERFTRKLNEVLAHRMNNMADKYQRAMSRARGEAEIIQALLAVRKELIFLYDAADIPAVPEQFRKQICQQVKDQADVIQKSLEDSSKSDRTGKMSSIIRNHRVNML